MRGLLAGTLVTAALLLGAAPASSRAAGAGQAPILGMVPHAGATTFLPSVFGAAGYGPLVYHGGPTLRTNDVYAIYWIPSGFQVSAGYVSLINGYFASVAAASGTSGNVYSTDTQYYDTTGPIAYQSTFADYYVDTHAFPGNGCDDGSDPVCLTNEQLKSEILHVIATKNWPIAATSLFFIMTPDQVGICAQTNVCTTNTFCAYHSAFSDYGGNWSSYAVEPYDATIGGGGACWDGQSPNGDAADATINTISHEHNEAITDPTGEAWFAEDGSGDENGDLCAWNFGAALGGAPGHSYNQVINGHYYWLQTEYSNDGATCLQRYALPNPPPTNAALPAVSGVAAVGQVLTTTVGTWTGSPTAYAYQWQECTVDGTGCADIPGATGSSYQLGTSDAGHTVRSKIVATNVGGSSIPSVSVPTAVVVGVPASTAQPAVSGVAAVGKELSATAGTWSTAAAFNYHWLRCHPNGSRCTTIVHATKSRYKLSAADGGHTLKAQVSATNAAGTTTVLSAHTAVVVAVPSVRKKPKLAGQPKAGHRLRARNGIWRGPPARYRYAWLRCNAQGRACRRIEGARYVRYRLRKSDAGHTLRVRVIALNAAGKARATSGPSRVVS